MSKEGQWWTAPTESESGRLIMVTCRKDIEKFRSNPRFSIRVEIAWPYAGDRSGMPDKETSEMMDKAQSALQNVFMKDPVAVLTGITTGDDYREWVFYTLSNHIFGRKLNEALSEMPLLPLEIRCENDPDWDAYEEMSEAEIDISE